MCGAVVISSCNTYTGSGAYAGASLGGILGSAIGGIGGGPRGSDIGTVIGMAGGAIVGGALGAKTGQEEEMEAQRGLDEYKARRSQSGYERGRSNRYNSNDDTYRIPNNGYHGQSDEYTGNESYANAPQNNGAYSSQGNTSYAQQDDVDSGFDPNCGGDDVLYDFNGSDYHGSYSAEQPTTVSASQIESISKTEPIDVLEIRNARFVDDNTDNVLTGGELSKVIFEIYNHSNHTLYDVQPTVKEVTGNRRIYISPGIHVEKIAPCKGVRYTAMVKADKRIKSGEAVFQVYAVQGNGTTASNVKEFRIAVEKLRR